MSQYHTNHNSHPKHSTNHNISWRDLINETWVSKPLAETKVIPSDEELFGRVLDKFAD